MSNTYFNFSNFKTEFAHSQLQLYCSMHSVGRVLLVLAIDTHAQQLASSVSGTGPGSGMVADVGLLAIGNELDTDDDGLTPTTTSSTTSGKGKGTLIQQLEASNGSTAFVSMLHSVSPKLFDGAAGLSLFVPSAAAFEAAVTAAGYSSAVHYHGSLSSQHQQLLVARHIVVGKWDAGELLQHRNMTTVGANSLHFRGEVGNLYLSYDDGLPPAHIVSGHYDTHDDSRDA